MQLYVSKNGQRYGPYSLEELRKAVLARVFRPEDFATPDQGQTWGPISACRSLAEAESVLARPSEFPERPGSLRSTSTNR